ncbi:MAG TPA: beta-Ala-His dipeptidase [Phycisphaerae bacterium]|nr:beta-Ala-His dipeptidase [Phycisphaerae bacterium]
MNTDADRSAIESLAPQSVWRFFAGIAAVPRPSKREQKIRAHVKQLAESHRFKVREDSIGNLVIEVPATKGCESAPAIVLQGHLDMVCEKDSGTTHNFDSDPIRLLLDKSADGKQIIRADGTTLGADNGIGVSLALAAATEPAAVHGPLEILCTIDEEDGMSGAKAIAPDFFKGRRMLNLDSEEDDAIYIGCAGGTDTTLIWSLPMAAPPPGAESCQLVITGLTGGHSGCDIHLNRVSAIAVLWQTLQAIDEPQIQLATISGGSKRNAIPREAAATVTGPRGLSEKLTNSAKSMQAHAVALGEAGCKITVQSVAAPAVASVDDTRRVLTALAALPHGVLAVVPEIPGLVQTSNGTTTIKSTSAEGTLRVEVGCLTRSSSNTDMCTVLSKIAAIARLAGAQAERANEYPGWAPNLQSPTLAVCRAAYERVFQKAPRIASIHAGLECGIIGERVGSMDMVSFGPNIQGAHSPGERVEVASVERMYRYLLAVLADLAKRGPGE